MQRIDRIKYYLKIAKVVSERASCPRAKVGCVLVDGKTMRLKSIGYNGAPPGVEHCYESGCIINKGGHCLRSIHAEINALAQLRGEWDHLVAFVTHQPCIHCYQALVAFKVKQVFYINPYQDEDRDKLIEVFHVPTIKVDLDE